MLVTRLLTSSSDSEVHLNAHQFLHEARSVTFGWLLELQDKLRDANDITVIADYQNRVCEMAAICRSTFDVEPHRIPSLLVNPVDHSMLVKCFIALYDNKPSSLEHSSKHIQALLNYDQRLSHKMLPYLLQELSLDSQIFCRAVSDLWSSYQSYPGGWTELPAPNTRWISTITASESQIPKRVHLNLLEGCLLIDGKPLNRLPNSYSQHPTYIRLFGQVQFPPIHYSSGPVRIVLTSHPTGYPGRGSCQISVWDGICNTQVFPRLSGSSPISQFSQILTA